MESTNQPAARNLRLKRETAAERFCRDPGAPLNAPTSPSIWFSRRYPDEAERWGCPVLEEVAVDMQTGVQTTTPLHLNDNFFAAILSDRLLGHRVVFYEPEQQWWFLDPVDSTYHPTTEAKLIVLLSALLARCAEEMPATVNRYNLFVTFRDDGVLKGVVRKARSILAADSSFFSVTSSNKRVEGPETAERAAKQFILSSVQQQPQAKITVTETFNAFQRFCTNNGLIAVHRRQFKQLIAETIREEFGLGLRHDVDRSGKSQQGWVGLSLKDRMELAGGLERN